MSVHLPRCHGDPTLFPLYVYQYADFVMLKVLAVAWPSIWSNSDKWRCRYVVAALYGLFSRTSAFCIFFHRRSRITMRTQYLVWHGFERKLYLLFTVIWNRNFKKFTRLSWKLYVCYLKKYLYHLKEDISHQKVATQSHTFEGSANFEPSNAVDGNIATCMRTKYIGFTSKNKTMWWKVDLGGVYNIYSISILFKNYDGYDLIRIHMLHVWS